LAGPSFDVPGLDEPVRVHVQWQGNTARIWLGVDASQLDRLSELANRVSRWLSEQGFRLVSLVCNGQTWGGQEAGAPASDSPRPWPPTTASFDPQVDQEPGFHTFIDIVAAKEF
jgi:hypothetical protein